MFGRGSYTRWDKRTTTNELLQLDALTFARSGSGAWGWEWADGRKSSITYTVLPGQGVRLMYTNNKTDVQDYVVNVVTTRCYFGGVRRWWLCPRCNRRCRILYGGRMFVCRKCSGAYYHTQQSKDIAVRIHNELKRLRAKLGAKSVLSDDVPPKPRGMHWRTYGETVQRIMDLQAAEELIQTCSILSYGETVGIGQPGHAAGLMADLRRLLGK